MHSCFISRIDYCLELALIMNPNSIRVLTTKSYQLSEILYCGQYTRRCTNSSNPGAVKVMF